MAVKRIDAGPATSYAYAVAHGYIGTESQWIAQLMEVTENAQAAEEAAQTATEAVSTFDAAVAAGIASVQAEGQTQVMAVGSAGTTQTAAVNAAGAAQVSAVEAEGITQKGIVTAEAGDQLQAISDAGDDAVDAVESAQATAVGAVETAQSTAVNAVQTKGTEVIESIPADYTELTGDVTDLKSAIDSQRSFSHWTIGEISASGNTIAASSIAVSSFETYRQGIAVIPETGCKLALFFYDADKAYLGKVAADGSINKTAGDWKNFTSRIEIDDYAPSDAKYFIIQITATDGTTFTWDNVSDFANSHVKIDDTSIDEINETLTSISETMFINHVDQHDLLSIPNSSIGGDGWYNVSPNQAHSKYNTNPFPAKAFKENTQYTLSFDAKYTGTVASTLIIGFYYTDQSRQSVVVRGADENHYVLTSAAGKTVERIYMSYNNADLTKVRNFMVVEGTTEPSIFIPYNGETAVDIIARDMANSANAEMASIRGDVADQMAALEDVVNRQVEMEISRNMIGPDLNVLYPVPPLKTGDVVTISAFVPSNVSTWCHVRFHAADGTQIKYYQFDTGYVTNGRTVTLDLGTSTASYISVNHDCGSPLMVERGAKTDFIPHYTTNYEKYLNSQSNFGEFELFLPEQADIIRNNLATARMAKRLSFGHVSDNHSTTYKLICDIIDSSDAQFIVNTGDIVQDKYSDAYTNVPDMINAMTKPHYITLGNHDVYKAPSASDIFTKFFAPIIDHNGQTGLDKTYYSVDFASEGIRCIFLDPYDAIPNYDVSMETIIAGKMSSTQINWFMDQLDGALSGSMHVCIFLHLSPEIVGEKEPKFFDMNTYESSKASYAFIANVIDAFMDGSSVTFDYDGNSYAHTFASSGVFVGYFCGHMHYDCIGKLKTHERQNAFSVARPWQSPSAGDKEGTYRHGSSKWGFSVFNYVTVDPTSRHVSIMRVLQQDTKYGFKRDFVTMEY